MSKNLRTLVCVMFCLIAISAVGISAFAATDGTYVEWRNGHYYHYEVNGGNATITGVDQSIAGAITIPSTLGGYTVVAISNDAFTCCEYLTSVTIPASITTIGEFVFTDCYNLAAIKVNSSNEAFKAINGVLYTKDGKTLIKYPSGKTSTAFAVPEGVTHIDICAFESCDYLTSVTISNSVTSIAHDAFGFLNNLERVIIPDSVISIGSFAFGACPNLIIYTEMESKPEGWEGLWNFSESPVIWGYVEGATYTEGYYTYTVTDEKATIAYVDKKVSGDIVIASLGGYPIVAIGYEAFSNCTNLTGVTMPEGVLSMGAMAFYDCDNLIRVTIPESVKFIGERAFGGCTNLSDVVIPNSVTSISDYAFWHCDNLGSVTIPGSVTCIGDYAFEYCFGLSSISIPNSITRIGEGAFRCCESLASVIIPEETITVGSDAFAICTSITICAEAASKPAGWESNWNSSNRPVVWGYVADDGADDGVEDGTYTDSYYTYTVTDGKATITAVDPAISGDITIPSTLGGYPVVAIGESAFYGCKNITKVTIPNSVTSIGSFAFERCRGLTDIIIPISVTKMGVGVISAPDVTIYVEATEKPEGWNVEWNNGNYPVVWGYVADDGADDGVGDGTYTDGYYTYTVTDGKATITAVDTAISGDITIPATLGGRPVVAIGTEAFYNCRGLTGVIIPEGVTTIGDYAFRNCHELASVSIPLSVTTIGSSAFWDCNELEAVSISANVTSIGKGAFAACSALTSIDIDEDNQVYKSVDGVLYTKDGNTLIQYPRNKSGASYNIPSDVIKVEGRAFWFCSNIVTVTVPASVTDIGDYAFEGGYKLAAINVDAGNTVYNSEDGVLYTKDGKTLICYPGGNEEESFVIPANVTSIYRSAFYDCENLTNVYIHKNVAEIGSNAFTRCSSLTIYAEAESQPAGWKTGWNYSNCPVVWGYVADDGVEDGTYTDGYYTYTVTDGKATITAVDPSISGDITIPATLGGYPVVEIGEDAFAWSYNITSVTIPEGVERIGRLAFNGCDFTTISIPSSVVDMDDALFQCYDLLSVNVADDNTVYMDIDGVLYTKDGKTLLQYPAGRTDTDYVIPADVKIIGDQAFRGSDLENVTIPNGVEGIESGVFMYCRNITSVTIPASVTSIASTGAFSYCYNLASITVADGNTAYKDVDGVLYTKDGTKLIQYPLGKAGTSYAILPGVTAIEPSAFKSCTNLTSVTIPEGVTSIGWYAFRDCTNLTSITIPEGVTSIDWYAFQNCSKLAAITVADGNTSYKSVDGVLYTKNGTELIKYPAGKADTSYAILPGVKAIEKEAFDDCTNLTSVTIPASVTTIGFDAFRNCTNLTIFAEAASQPAGWDVDWNYSNCPVVWGYVDYSKYYTYTVTDGKATITAVDTAISGDIAIPATLGGYPVVAIGRNAFGDCDSITDIIIPEGVIEIGKFGFNNCLALTSVNIPASVTIIGDEAFCRCWELTSITVADDNPAYKSVDDVLFTEDGTTLIQYPINSTTTSYVIPSGVDIIANEAFYGADALISVIIPESVTQIGNYAFRYCDNLTSITISANVTSIGIEAFGGCPNLVSITVDDGNTAYKSVDDVFYTIDGETLVQYPAGKADTTFAIPDGVTTIEPDAFYQCDNLTSVVIPDGVATIGYSAFMSCSSLTSVTIPASVTSIGSSAFAYCSKLVSITVDTDNTAYKSEDGVLYTIDGKTLMQYPADKPDTRFAIPDGVSSIGSYAFASCQNITGITIANSVTSIGYNAFSICTKLTSVGIPAGVTTIGNYAFSSCNNLTIYAEAASQPGGWDSRWNSSNCPVVWGYTDGVEYTEGYYTFIANDGKATITAVDTAISGDIAIPATLGGYPVVAVAYNAFFKCDNITSVTVPASVISMKDTQYIGCGLFHSKKITSITVESGNTSYKSVDGVLYTIDGKTLVQYPAAKTDTTFTIPADVTTIGSEAFGHCTNLTSITIPEGVTTIGSYAFYNCTNLTSITIPASVTSIGYYAFGSCTNLTSVTIPEGVTTIGNYAFQSCDNLTSVTIPASVTSIGTGAFSYCSKLAAITVVDGNTSYKSVDGVLYTKDGTKLIQYPAKKADTSYAILPGVTAIEPYAFGYCSNLTSITIPEGVTTIGSYAFNSCTNLTSITITASVTSIGTGPFESCSKLAAITVADGNPSYKSVDSVLYTKDGTKLIQYPAKKADTSYAILPGVTAIEPYAFYNCDNLTSVTIPEGVTTIGSYAFNSCTNLTSITIPASVTSIATGAFRYCTNLTSVTIPDSVISIGANAFLGCSNLTSIAIPSSVTTMGVYVFNENNTIFAEAASQPAGWDTGWKDSNCPVVWDYLNAPATITINKTSATITTIGRTLQLKATIVSAGQISTAAVWTSSNPAVATVDATGLVTAKSNGTCTITATAADGTLSAACQITVNDSNITYTEGYYTYKVKDGKATITAVDTAISGDITIPATLGGYPVVEIGNSACQSRSNLIGIIIPEGVTTIGNQAFYNCWSLTSVTIPASVTSIGNGAFRYCSKLAAITVADGNTSYKSVDGVLYTKDGTKLIQYPAKKADTSYAILPGVTVIEYEAFYNCSNLTSITIPASVTSIGNDAFRYCSKLATITVADGNTSYKSVDGVLYTKDGTKLIQYPAGKADTSYAILPGVTVIEYEAFYNCSNLTSITIPEGVTTIGRYAFEDCTKLTSITIPASVTSIGTCAFRLCSKLATITVADGNTSYKSVDGVLYTKDGTKLIKYPEGKADTSYAILPGVTAIEQYAFYECTNFTSVTIPEGVTTIGNYAFRYCSNLTIYAEAASQPSGWNANWNYSNRPVVWGYVAPTGISLNKTTAALDISNLTVQLAATVLPDNANPKTVTWTSSNTAVATVDASGKVTAKSKGTAIITATTVNGLSAQCTVTVTLPVMASSVTLNNRNVQMDNVGDTFTLSATVLPADAEDKTVTWKSSNTSVATVDANGKVTAVGEGTAIITATSVNGKKSSCRVYVGERNVATPTDGGTFRYYFTSCPPTVNPLTTQDTNPWTLIDLISGSLYRTYLNDTKDGWVYEPYMAAELPRQVDADGFVWEYKIEPGMTWENGDPITVDDFEFTFRMHADPLQQNLSASSMTMSSYGVIKNIYEYQMGEVKDWADVGYKKIDDYTFQATFTRPITEYDAINACNCSLVNPKLYTELMTADKTATTYGTSLDTTLSCGPYILTEWIPDSKFVLTRNHDFVRADWYHFDEIVIICVPDTSTAVQLFEKGELDYASISFSMWETYEDDPRLHEYFNDSLMYMFVNWGNPRGNYLLGNLKFRQALHYGMDRVEIANTLHVYPATRLVRKAVMANYVTGEMFVDVPQNYVEDGYTVRNTTKALQLLTQAFEENNVESFELRILTGDTTNAATSHIRAASDILMRQYNDLFKGKMTTVYQVVPANQTTQLRRYNPDNPGAFDTAVGSLLPSAKDPRATFNYYRSDYSPPRFCYGDPVYDAWYAEAMSYDLQKDTDKIVELCQKMEEKLLAELAVIPVYETATKVLFSENVVLPAGGYVPGFGWGMFYASMTAPIQHVESVSLNKTTATLDAAGDTLQLTATVLPENAVDNTVTWKSSNTSVATVDANGKVTAVGEGVAVITVTSVNGINASCKVRVGEGAPYTGNGIFRTPITSSPATVNQLTTQGSVEGELINYLALRLWRDIPVSTDVAGWQVAPDLADGWPTPVGTDGLTWEIKIQRNAKWESGEPITVDDIIFTYQCYANPIQQNLSASSLTGSAYGRIKNLYEYQMGTVKSWDQVGIKKIDDYTFRVEMEASVSAADVRKILNQGLIYEPLYTSGLTADGTATNYGTSVGTYMSAGPFVLTEWIPDVKITLAKNPYYIHADEINLAGIEFYIVPDKGTQLQMFLNGELDYVALSYNDWETYNNDSRLYQYSTNASTWIMVNVGNTENNGLLGDLNYREALFYGIDRESLAASLSCIPTTSNIRPDTIANPLTGQLYVDIERDWMLTPEQAYDTTKANRFLDKAYETRNLTASDLTILYSESSAIVGATAEILQKQFENTFGNRLVLKLDARPSSQVNTLRRWNPDNPNAYQAALGYLQPSMENPRAYFNYFKSTYSPPRFCYADPAYDAMYNEAASLDLEKDNARVIELCLAMEKQLYEDRINIAMYRDPTKVLFSDDVTLPAGGYVTGYGWGIMYASMGEPVQKVTSVSLNKTTATLAAVGGTLQLTATVLPENAEDKTVTWKSSNTSVATVDANGKVTAVSDGVATITATTADGGKTATCTVTVNSSAPKAEVKGSSAKAGETVTVDIVLSDAPNLETLGASDIIYNTDVLELIGFEWKVKDAFLSNWDSATGMGAVIYSSPSDLNGTIISLSFKVKDSAEDGDYTVSCTVISHESDLANISGKITVYSVVLGDLDGNEVVDKADAIRLMMHIMFPSVYPVNQNADFTGDMVVDKNDAIYLMMHIMFPNAYPLK